MPDDTRDTLNSAMKQIDLIDKRLADVVKEVNRIRQQCNLPAGAIRDLVVEMDKAEAEPPTVTFKLSPVEFSLLRSCYRSEQTIYRTEDIFGNAPEETSDALYYWTAEGSDGKKYLLELFAPAPHISPSTNNSVYFRRMDSTISSTRWNWPIDGGVTRVNFASEFAPDNDEVFVGITGGDE